MRILSSAAIILLATVVAVPARVLATGTQEKPADVAGTWAISVDIGGNTGTPSVTLKQDGETLTGTYSSQVFGEQKVTGSIKGSNITFGFSASLEGTNVKVTYTGTVDKAAMKGTVTLGELGEGTFTAKKQ
jgi:hypothetical protein